jgi:hypothetical protein
MRQDQFDTDYHRPKKVHPQNPHDVVSCHGDSLVFSVEPVLTTVNCNGVYISAALRLAAR